MISLYLTLLLLPGATTEISQPDNPHTPWNQTWIIISGGSNPNRIISRISSVAPRDTWFPDLYADLCDLGGRMWGPSGNEPDILPNGKELSAFAVGCDTPGGRAKARQLQFYVCPGHSMTKERRQKCGGENYAFCGSWGCESTGSISWDPPTKGDFITVQRVGDMSIPGIGWCGNQRCGNCYDIERFSAYAGARRGGHCNPLIIRFTEAGKQADWTTGKTWGLHLHPGSGQLTFTIKRTLTPVETVAVGPDRVLNPTITPSLTKPALISAKGLTVAPKKPAEQLLSPPIPSDESPLYTLLQKSFLLLNASKPELTVSCWLCYDARPPFYEGTAVEGNYTMTSKPQECRWQAKASLTIQQVQGQGVCIGTVPTKYQAHCNNTRPLPDQDVYLQPPDNTWWACSTGLTPCAHVLVLNRTKGFCIMIQLLPRLIYYSEEELESLAGPVSLRRSKREPLTALTLSILLGTSIAGLGTGAAALVQQQQHYSSLRESIDEDIEKLEFQITHLQESLTSLAEVVLQNRRGLDLIFLKEKGLCAALGEECCFYIDHSGVIKDSVAKVREGIAQRKREREANQGWFEAWYSKSPGFTTLISSILGPLILLILLLIFGPCIINMLVRFMKQRLGTIQLMVQRGYTPISLTEPYRASEELGQESYELIEAQD